MVSALLPRVWLRNTEQINNAGISISKPFLELTQKDWTERIYNQIKEVPLDRAAKLEEIAEIILFAASDKASYINGQTIIADGGYSIRS
ncbi:MAG: SDR family oxidoreductase [Patescibacteria group bacterium]